MKKTMIICLGIVIFNFQFSVFNSLRAQGFDWHRLNVSIDYSTQSPAFLSLSLLQGRSGLFAGHPASSLNIGVGYRLWGHFEAGLYANYSGASATSGTGKRDLGNGQTLQTVYFKDESAFGGRGGPKLTTSSITTTKKRKMLTSQLGDISPGRGGTKLGGGIGGKPGYPKACPTRWEVMTEDPPIEPRGEPPKGLKKGEGPHDGGRRGSVNKWGLMPRGKYIYVCRFKFGLFNNHHRSPEFLLSRDLNPL